VCSPVGDRCVQIMNDNSRNYFIYQLTANQNAFVKHITARRLWSICACIWSNVQRIWPIAFDKTALPIFPKGKNTNTKLISQKDYNVEFIMSW